MAQYAMIQDNVVINVCEWDGVTPFDPGEGITLTPMSYFQPGIWIGWTRTPEGAWNPPPAVDIADL